MRCYALRRDGTTWIAPGGSHVAHSAHKRKCPRESSNGRDRDTMLEIYP